MATVCEHLSVGDLEEQYVGCEDATASRHFQVIWLLARGHTISQVSATTAYGERWIEQLLARYNAEGPEALGDLRRRNGALATILKAGLLDKLRLRLDDALPSARGVSYNTDLIRYIPLHSELKGKSFFKENTTTLIKIKLQLSVDKTVYDFPKADDV